MELRRGWFQGDSGRGACSGTDLCSLLLRKYHSPAFGLREGGWVGGLMVLFTPRWSVAWSRPEGHVHQKSQPFLAAFQAVGGPVLVLLIEVRFAQVTINGEFLLQAAFLPTSSLIDIPRRERTARPGLVTIPHMSWGTTNDRKNR